nr:LuxR C-terminal-related transcriptional regulator [Anaerolinea sp.]
LGKADVSIRHARRVLDLAPEDDFLRRGGATAIQGLVFWARGDLEAARRVYPEGIQYLRRAGHLSDATGCALALADIVITQGHLREAMGIYEQTLRFASERGMPHLRGTADMLVGMSELHYEWNDLPAATQCLLRARDQGEHTGLPQNRYRWRVAMARVRVAEGDLNGAIELLDEAESLYMSDFSPQVRPIPAVKARLWAAQGRLEEALNWAREQKLTAADDLNYLREYEHITLARILLAIYQRDREEGHLQEASALLERLLDAAESGGRVKSAIEIRILQALLFLAQGNLSASLAPLGQALALAEPEGWVRMFVDEGPPLRDGLREAAAGGIHPVYTGKLLAAFGVRSPDKSGEVTAPVSRASTAAGASNDTLVEPLSQRELDVLRLFRTELSGPEIARELVVALSTVRTHTKSIYSKLNVSTRRAAVRRATELGLI